MFYAHDLPTLIKTEATFGSTDSIIRHIQIDTRQNQIDPESTLFVAIKGQNHDGNDYLTEAYSKGFRTFICTSRPKTIEKDAFYIQVNDSNYALWTLAKNHRNTFNFPVVGITGSNGKTIVKEWLFHLLAVKFKIERNPKSYNSQIGVPLALLSSANQADYGFFEAGISQPKEMLKHLRLLAPKIGILTNIGDAHQQNFDTIQDKIFEKIKLFTFSEVIIFNRDKVELESCLKKVYSEGKLYSWSKKNKNSKVYLESTSVHQQKTTLSIRVGEKKYSITFPFLNEIALENVMHCFTFLAQQELLDLDILKRFQSLPKLTMRMERRKGLYQSVLINDSYSNDLLSLKHGLINLQNETGKKGLILSDFIDSYKNKNEYYTEVIQLIKNQNLDLFIGIGKNWKNLGEQHRFSKKQFLFSHTKDFIKNFDRQNINTTTLLIKGARKFAFENIVQVLANKPHVASLEINIDHLIYNFQYFKSLLHKETKLMVMLKAFSYGVGSIEIAKILRQQNVDSIAVAYPNEGLELRAEGIKSDILVLNPPIEFIEIMIENNLEPEIYNIEMLEAWIQVLEKLKLANYPIHLKFNTGMNRLGFSKNQIKSISKKINQTNSVQLKSVFSHLVDSTNRENETFTLKQIADFNHIIHTIKCEFDYKFDTHILNTNGIINYPEFQENQVRLGIGLFGVGVSKYQKSFLKPVLKLSSTISQINSITKGESIGYNRSFIAQKDMTIATVAIGYADGLLRVFGNENTYLMVNGSPCPILGSICMDMCMIDVSNISAQEGDEVIVFDGLLRDLDDFAASGNMISYEVLCSLSERIQRNYTQEW